MNLHKHPEEFNDLVTITSEYIGIPAGAVKRDYFIVMMLEKLEESKYADSCVFKGGTSLSKCYPESIARFSEDIDLTFIPQDDLGNKKYDKTLKQIEDVMSAGFRLVKIPEERNDRNKSSFIWFDDTDDKNGKIKLEIGSSIRPDPYEKKSLCTYIQQYLSDHGMDDAISEYGLRTVQINTLAIERTFLDKVMSVKRHAICGNLSNKVRHIYDVTMLYRRDDIQKFLADKKTLKGLLQTTKATDSFYLEKRGISKEYDPIGDYDFPSWKKYFDQNVKKRYESLHEDLLFTNEKQDFQSAVSTFENIDRIFKSIGE